MVQDTIQIQESDSRDHGFELLSYTAYPKNNLYTQGTLVHLIYKTV